MEEKLKISRDIERVGYNGFRQSFEYIYKFDCTQYLESIDNFEIFNIEYDDVKESVIESLVENFRISLNGAIFGDPAGKQFKTK